MIIRREDLDPQVGEHIETLRQREAYLTGRAALKQSLGWEFTYDQRERDALRWALARLWWSPDNGGNDDRRSTPLVQTSDRA